MRAHVRHHQARNPCGGRVPPTISRRYARALAFARAIGGSASRGVAMSDRLLHVRAIVAVPQADVIIAPGLCNAARSTTHQAQAHTRILERPAPVPKRSTFVNLGRLPRAQPHHFESGATTAGRHQGRTHRRHGETSTRVARVRAREVERGVSRQRLAGISSAPGQQKRVDSARSRPRRPPSARLAVRARATAFYPFPDGVRPPCPRALGNHPTGRRDGRAKYRPSPTISDRMVFTGEKAARPALRTT